MVVVVPFGFIVAMVILGVVLLVFVWCWFVDLIADWLRCFFR